MNRWTGRSSDLNYGGWRDERVTVYGVMLFSLIIYSTDSHLVSNLDAVLNRQKLNV